MNNEQYADLIEPLMVWLLRRINDVLYNPANLGVPKHILIEEIFSSMKNRQLLEGALASIKTVRKNLGGVTMIGQSAEDLGANADTHRELLHVVPVSEGRDLQPQTICRAVQDERAADRTLRELAGPRGALHAPRRTDQSCEAQSRQPQLRHILHQAERPGAPVEADRQVRTHRGHRRVLPRARPRNQSHRKDTSHETAHPHRRRLGLSLAAHAVAAHAAHRRRNTSQPSAPRTVMVSEADTPPVIRAGLLQSTLIVLPAEEKVANVFAGDTVDWVFDGGHVASRFISIKPKVGEQHDGRSYRLRPRQRIHA